MTNTRHNTAYVVLSAVFPFFIYLLTVAQRQYQGLVSFSTAIMIGSSNMPEGLQ